MNTLEKLIAHFEKFPGIGARQAKRFAFHILTLPPAAASELAALITSLGNSVTECTMCRRFFATKSNEEMCSICADTRRDAGKLLVVERDSDVQSLERASVYDGLYFVLGGTVPLLNSHENQKLRGGALKGLIEHRLENNLLREIILAFSVNPDGENTERYVRSLIAELTADKNVTITHLGRGLSTGSELEYADPETLKNALKNRE